MLLAAAAVPLLFSAVAGALGTGRLQYRWSLHLRPACHVVVLLLVMLPVVAMGYMAADQILGGRSVVVHQRSRPDQSTEENND